MEERQNALENRIVALEQREQHRKCTAIIIGACSLVGLLMFCIVVYTQTPDHVVQTRTIDWGLHMLRPIDHVLGTSTVERLLEASESVCDCPGPQFGSSVGGMGPTGIVKGETE